MNSLFVLPKKDVNDGSGFSLTPAPNANDLQRFSRKVDLNMGYAPDGMTEAQYKAM